MAEVIAHTRVSLFRDSFTSTPVGDATLAQVLDDIRAGRYAAQVRRVRRILACEGKAAYDRAKASLRAVTFGGRFAPRRGNAHLQRHSGLLHIDMDHLDNVLGTKRALSADPHIAYVFISPSAMGLKAGVRIPTISQDLAYKHAWHTAKAVYEPRYGVRWDPSGKDVSRLCFVSYDPDLYVNLDAEVFDVQPAPAPESKPTPLQTLTSTTDRGHDYAERAIQTATAMIQSAPMGTRHHTRLRAARLLGGYVAGGLLSEERAYGALAQALVGYTEHLPAALKTVEDGLAYGQAHPITVDALEAERQAWIAQHLRQTPRDHPDESRQTRVEGISTPYHGYQGYRAYRGYRKGTVTHG